MRILISRKIFLKSLSVFHHPKSELQYTAQYFIYNINLYKDANNINVFMILES